MEIIRDKKWKLETNELIEMKPVLGHIEFGDDAKGEEKEVGASGNEPPFKHRVTQSVSALKEAKRKENISQQEQWWMELTQGC